MKEVYDKISGKFENPRYAGNVEEGLKELASGDYGLVITDYDLGDKFPQGGLKIIEAAKNKGLTRILMSKKNHRKEAEELGVIFLFKKEIFESKNINKLIGSRDGRK